MSPVSTPRRSRTARTTRADHRPRGRVEVQVGDVQDAGGVLGRLVDRQGGDRGVDPADVGDQLLQLVGVPAVVVGDPPRVTDHGGRVDQQALVARLLDRVAAGAVPTRDAEARRRDHQREHARTRRPAGRCGRPARPAAARRGPTTASGAQAEPDARPCVTSSTARAGWPALMPAGSSISASVRPWSSAPRRTCRWAGPSWLSRCSEPSGGMATSVPPLSDGRDRHLGPERADVGARRARRAARRRTTPASATATIAQPRRRCRRARDRARRTRPRPAPPSGAHDRRRGASVMSPVMAGHPVPDSTLAGAAAGEHQPEDAVVVGRRARRRPSWLDVVTHSEPSGRGDRGAQPAVLAGQQRAGLPEDGAAGR